MKPHEILERYQVLKCSVCCNQVFDTKQALIEHLRNFKISCSTCCEEFITITELIDHINSSQCENKVSTIDSMIKESFYEVDLSEANGNFGESNCLDGDVNQEIIGNHSNSDHIYSLMTNSEEQTLTKNGDGNISPYMIINNDESPAIFSKDKIITTQNSDGTISLRFGNNEDQCPKPESDPVIKMSSKDQDENDPDEVYSCNDCKLSFTSVLEHIQKFHSDQDVVVEMSDEDVGHNEDPYLKSEVPTVKNEITSIKTEVPIVETEVPTVESEMAQLTPIQNDEQDWSDIQNAKRVITDTGNIVLTNGKQENKIKITVSEDQDIKTLQGQQYKKKNVKKDSCLTPKPVKSYHQVVIKEMIALAPEGNKKLKVYNCTLCNLYVSNLEQFSAHPCSSGSVAPTSNAVFLTDKVGKQHKRTKKKKPVENKNNANKHSETTGEVETIGGTGQENNPLENTVKISETFTCDMCSTEFTSNKSLKLHRRMHDPIKTRPIEPPVSQQLEGKDEEIFYCRECDKVIPIGYQKVHEKYHQHEDFNCDKCNKKFSSRVYLTMHMNVHSVEKVEPKKSDKTLPYICSYCKRRFSRPHEKVKHERIHTGEKPHSCEICGKSFRVSYCLTLHMRTHTGARPYACTFCGKRFKAHSVYNHHLLTHSDVRAYKCPFCPKAFKTAVQLAGHKNSHTKPFSCETCNRPFASLYAVRVHSETHSRNNNLKFSCKLCGASYARTFALNDHMKQVHNICSSNPDRIDHTATVTENIEPQILLQVMEK